MAYIVEGSSHHGSLCSFIRIILLRKSVVARQTDMNVQSCSTYLGVRQRSSPISRCLQFRSNRDRHLQRAKFFRWLTPRIAMVTSFVELSVAPNRRASCRSSSISFNKQRNERIDTQESFSSSRHSREDLDRLERTTMTRGSEENVIRNNRYRCAMCFYNVCWNSISFVLYTDVDARREKLSKKPRPHRNDIGECVEHRRERERERIDLLLDKYQSSVFLSLSLFSLGSWSVRSSPLVYNEVQTWWRLSSSKFLIRISAIFWSIFERDAVSSIDH